MDYNKHCFDYKIIATLFSNENIEVLVAYKKENTPENLYILNKIPYSEKNKNLFTELFLFYSSPNRPKDFENFFVFKNDFYAVFKYADAENIETKYNKKLNIAKFEERCILLENILVKIDLLSKMPLYALASVTQIENIRMDNEKSVKIIYNFKNIFENIKNSENKNRSIIFKNISNIIFSMLQQECEAYYNKSLHIVLKKCENTLYNSIPELIIELKKAEEHSKISSWISYIKSLYEIRKPIISKLINFSIVAFTVYAVISVAYKELNKYNVPYSSETAVTIGEITYNTTNKDESAKDIIAERPAYEFEKKDFSNLVLPQEADVEFEDYIVQHGDTIPNICENYYKDVTFSNCVASFNNKNTGEKLIAGTILRLPNKSAAILHT